MTTFNKEQLFAALESEVQDIHVGAVGAKLRFKMMTGRGRDAFHSAIEKGDKALSHFEAAIVAAVVVDESGAPMFSPEDVATLQDKNASAVAAIAQVALSVNKIGVEAEAAAAKN